jgi:signal peptidase I
MEKNIYAISYKMKRDLQHRIMVIVAAVIICLVFLSLFMTFVLFPVKSKSVSMNPAIPAGSVEFVSPLLRNPDRGDIMLISGTEKNNPNTVVRALDMIIGFFTAQKFFPFTSTSRASGTPSIRRVAALPGDTIYLENYILHVKPKGEENFLTEFELSGMQYSAVISRTPDFWDGQLGPASKTEQYTLGSDEYYVLGDNRVQCADSRLWGPVSSSSFRGKVIVLYFPFNSFTWFRNKSR